MVAVRPPIVRVPGVVRALSALESRLRSRFLALLHLDDDMRRRIIRFIVGTAVVEVTLTGIRNVAQI